MALNVQFCAKPAVDGILMVASGTKLLLYHIYSLEIGEELVGFVFAFVKINPCLEHHCHLAWTVRLRLSKALAYDTKCHKETKCRDIFRL